MPSPSVFEVVTYDGRGQSTRHNLNALFLPGDHRPAHTLEQSVLTQALVDMAVPGVAYGTGKQDALLAYSRYLKSQVSQ